MASFDLHDKCARYRDKHIGDDMCVADKPRTICNNFTEAQKDMLSTPTCRMHKEKKTGVLVSPEDVTVIASVEDKEPTFQSPPPLSLPASAYAHQGSSTSFVTASQLKEISDQWGEQFTRFEALLSRGNVFSTPKAEVKPIPSLAL